MKVARVTVAPEGMDQRELYGEFIPVPRFLLTGSDLEGVLEFEKWKRRRDAKRRERERRISRRKATG